MATVREIHGSTGVAPSPTLTPQTMFRIAADGIRPSVTRVTSAVILMNPNVHFGFSLLNTEFWISLALGNGCLLLGR